MLSATELDALLAAHDEAKLLGLTAVLATVVEVKGSSYRRPGARMLVREDGLVIGGVSGGCLEEDVVRKCRLSMMKEQPVLLHYDTTDDEDNAFGTALGCGGCIAILLEPLACANTRLHIACLAARRSSRVPQVLLIGFEGNSIGVMPQSDALWPFVIQTHIDTTLRTRRSHTMSLGTQKILFEYVRPAMRLLVIGAGQDVEPLANCAALMGFGVLVVDERPGFLSRRHFSPQIQRLNKSLALAIPRAELDEYTACVIATHSYSYDVRALEHLSAGRAGYIGLLGPRQRSMRVLDALMSVADRLSAFDVRVLHTPIGLDIGADTPEQIALAILAEIQAVYARRPAGFLRDRKTSIHSNESGMTTLGMTELAGA